MPSQRDLEALDQQQKENLREIDEATRALEYTDNYYDRGLLIQRIANAKANQHNLTCLYHEEIQREQAAQYAAPRPVSEGEQLQRDIWNQIATGNAQVDQYLTHRWKVGEAVARGADPGKADLGNHVPGRLQRRQGGN